MQTNYPISYSDGRTIPAAVVQIWDDMHNEAAGFYRAYWSESKDSDTGSPVIGYCSAGGSHRTVRAVAAEVRRYYPDAEIFRNGYAVK